MKNFNLSYWLITATSFAFIVVGCSSAPPPTIQSGPEAELSFDGLHKVDNSQADMAWARPDFDLSGYTKLMPVNGGIEYAEAVNQGRTTRDRNRGGPFLGLRRLRASLMKAAKLATPKASCFTGHPASDCSSIRAAANTCYGGQICCSI